MLAFNDATLIAGIPPTVPVEAAQCSYAAADLDKSATAQFEVRSTPELTALADSLDYSPVKIFKWVYENVKYEPYYGSLKGAQATYLARGGNDTDQASLLLALFRAVGIPCRYVRGTVEMTPNQAKAWLGVDDAGIAGNILTTAGMEGVNIVSGTNVLAIRCTRVWVEAYVPYGNYRGVPNDTE